jgi:thioredoxin-related protein
MEMKSQKIQITVEVTFRPWIKPEMLNHFIEECVNRVGGLPEAIEAIEVKRKVLEPVEVKRDWKKVKRKVVTIKNSGTCITCGTIKKTTYGLHCPSCANRTAFKNGFCVDCGKVLKNVKPQKKRCAECSKKHIREYGILWRKNNPDKMKCY